MYWCLCPSESRGTGCCLCTPHTVDLTFGHSLRPGQGARTVPAKASLNYGYCWQNPVGLLHRMPRVVTQGNVPVSAVFLRGRRLGSFLDLEQATATDSFPPRGACERRNRHQECVPEMSRPRKGPGSQK